MMIAEEIIAGYFMIRDYLKETRNTYLKNKNKSYQSKKMSVPDVSSNRKKFKVIIT